MARRAGRGGHADFKTITGALNHESNGQENGAADEGKADRGEGVGRELCERFCADENMQAALAYLHTLARKGMGNEVQRHIDAHLAAVGYLSENPGRGRLAGMMVTSWMDSPQVGNLPDIGFMVRAVMSGAVVKDAGKAGWASKVSKFKQKEKGEGTASVSVYGVGGVDSSSGEAVMCPCVSSVGEDQYSVHMLLQALPCVRHAQGKKGGCVVVGHQVGINILMGLLLGLYPHAVKFPPFLARVELFMGIHRLLTHGTGAEFCSKHPMLMTVAYMEYCAHVIPRYMPAECEILCGEPGMAAFFDSFPLACDTMRQEILNKVGDTGGGDNTDKPGYSSSGKGEASARVWSLLEEHCAVLVDKHTRACKSRVRVRKEDLPGASKLNGDAVQAFATLPYLPSYEVHLEDASHCVRAGELAFLTGAGTAGLVGYESSILVSVAMMQRLIQVYPLPRNLVQMQLRSLHARMRVCERSAMEGMLLHVCSICGLSGGGQRGFHVKGQCRMDASEAYWMDTGAEAGGGGDNLVCTVCQRRSVMAVNTLGRVVVLRQQRYYLAPCCFSVQVYSGWGGEFQTEYCDPDYYGQELMERLAWRPDIRPSACTHRRVKAAGKPQRARCEVCVGNGAGANVGGSVAPETFTSVDHLSGAVRSIRLCHRHAPTAEALRFVCNWRQLMAEVQKRDRPLFSRRRVEAGE